MMPPHAGKAARPDRPTNSSLLFEKALEIARILSKLMFFAYPFRMWQKTQNWIKKGGKTNALTKTPYCGNCVYTEQTI